MLTSNAGNELLTSVDPSALADYNAVYDTINEMQIIPIDRKQYVLQAIVLALPFLPLVFLEISITELLKRILDSLILTWIEKIKNLGKMAPGKPANTRTVSHQDYG